MTGWTMPALPRRTPDGMVADTQGFQGESRTGLLRFSCDVMTESGNERMTNQMFEEVLKRYYDRIGVPREVVHRQRARRVRAASPPTMTP